MDNEHLFVMLDECIEYAAKVLTSETPLESFAMVLDHENNIGSVNSDETDGFIRYEYLLQTLRDEAKADKISALALLSNVTIPDNFNAPVESGIRIHIEEKAFTKENKLNARLLYVPYQLFKTKEDKTVQIKLHDPIPVALACEIFV